MILNLLNLVFVTFVALAVSGAKASRRSDYGRHVNTYEDEPNFTFGELWDLQNAFLTQIMYPNNVLQAKSINSDLLAPNVSVPSPSVRYLPSV